MDGSRRAPRLPWAGCGLNSPHAPRTLATMELETSYVCPSCGEEIVVPVDPSQGPRQEYVEDCPVCCSPNVLEVELDEAGPPRAWARAE